MGDQVDSIVSRIEEAGRHRAIEAKRQLLRAEFRDVDHQAITKMLDKDLAVWQSQFPTDSPQSIFAEHEWQRRLTVEQVKAMRFAAYIGVVGSICGVVAGAFLGAYLAKPAVEPERKQGANTNSQATIQNHVLEPKDRPVASVKPLQPIPVQQKPNAKN